MTITLNKSITSELVSSENFGYTLHESNLVSSYVFANTQQVHNVFFGNATYVVMLQTGEDFYYNNYDLPTPEFSVHSIMQDGQVVFLDDIELSNFELYEYIQDLCHAATGELDIDVDYYTYTMQGYEEDNYGCIEIAFTFEQVVDLQNDGFQCIEAFPKFAGNITIDIGA